MKPEFLNRYTSLPVLLDMLLRKELRLLSPQSWEDRNDAYYLEQYQTKRGLSTVLAVCFSATRETFHHWRVFTHGSSGVCVAFSAPKLLDTIRLSVQFKSGYVEYSRIDALEKKTPSVERWPFLKRLPYRDEAEFRVIYEAGVDQDGTTSIDFKVAAIRRITLSPWMAKPVADSVIKVIEGIPGCAGISISRSTLIENGRWKKAIQGLTKR